MDAPEHAAATLVLLHGRGYGPASMHELAGRLGRDDLAVVAPAAPGRTWYPGRFFEPRASNEPQLAEALETVHRTLDDLQARGVEPGRIVLGGFSQGACVACDAVAGLPRPLAALAILCGGLIGTQDEWSRPPAGALGGLPVLLTGTEQDAWVPVEHVRSTAGVLRAAGAGVDLRVSPPAPHGVHAEEVEALRRLVDAVIARGCDP